MKRFRRGLVVGKFCPLHRGHQSIIERARDDCDAVLVLSYTKPEFTHCEPEARDGWLGELFPATSKFVLDDARLANLCKRHGVGVRLLPDNSAADDNHRDFVAWLCQEVLGTTVDAVFTSEGYGPGFAAHLSRCFGSTVEHIAVDPGRLSFPISGTEIRADPHRQKGLLPPVVYASFVERVCLLGGESSGKTTLAKNLAAKLGTLWVPEYGRDLWEVRAGALSFDDMRVIAETQVAHEVAAAGSANRYLICDTSPLTTLFYSEALHSRVDPVVRDLASRKYNHTFLCASDFAFVQDGTRQDHIFRQRQQEWYVRELSRRHVSFIRLNGSLEDRLRMAISALGISSSPEDVRATHSS